MDARVVSGGRLQYADSAASDARTPRRLAVRRWIRAVALAAALLTIGWALADARFRDAEGAFTGLLVFPLSAGVGLAVAGLAVATEWQRAALWCGLALVGQAACLQLINAGWQLRYQHYKAPADVLATVSPLVWGLIVAQALVVTVALVARWAGIRAWIRAHVRPWQLALVASVFLVCTATVSEDVGFYLRELAFAGAVQTVQLANLTLVAMALPASGLRGLRPWLERLVGAPDDRVQPGAPGRTVIAAALGVVVVSALLNVLAYDRHPHVPDEVVYLTHAAFFAHGALTMPAPAVPEGFEVYLMEVMGDRWYPVPPPGWPAVLALGVLLGAPWLVNPVLAGINVLLGYVLLRELYPPRVARLAVLLLAVSPWYLFLGMSFMTHMLALTCALLATLGVAWARRTGRATWAWGGGLALGTISLIRPLEAVAVAALLGLWALGVGGARLRLAATTGLVVGALITGALGLLYNHALTGDPLQFPINAYTDRLFGPNVNAYGFGPDRGMGWAFDPYPGHSARDALINSNLNVSTLNTELFGWSIGSLLPLAVLVAFERLRRSDRLMAAAMATIYGLHFFFYFSGGPDFAARYWFLMVIPLVVLAARGCEVLAARAGGQHADADVRVYAALAVVCLMALVTFLPWRALDKYHMFRGMRPDVRALAHDYAFGSSLVLIRGNQHPDYDSAMVYNPVDLRAAAPIYAWDRDARTRTRLLAAYADRPVWLVDSPSITGRAFEVVAGPMAAGDLLQGEK